MFTALVLICTTDMYSMDKCIAVMANEMFRTEEECVIKLATDYTEGLFTFTTKNGKLAELKEYKCINWIEEKA